MANILNKFSGMFSSWIPGGGAIKGFLWGFGILLLLGLVGWFLWANWKNKNTYIKPIRIVRYLDNGMKKEINSMMGGEISVNGVKDFEIKYKFRKQRLGYIPDYSKEDGDGRLVFITSGDGKILQQMEETIVVMEKVQVKDEEGKPRTAIYSLVAKPIRTEVKTATLNTLRSWKEILDKKKLTIFAIGLGMFIIMVIAHLISLYIQTKIRCPVG